MKKSRPTDEQIAYALRLADGGTPVVDVCRQIGISEATCYTCSKLLPSTTSLTLPAVPRTVSTRPESAATPMWHSIPR